MTMDVDKPDASGRRARPALSARRLRKAASWLLRARQQTLPTHEFHAWLRWTQGDRRNLDAIERMRDLMQDLNAIDRKQKAVMARELLADVEVSSARQSGYKWGWRLVGGFATVALAMLILVGINHYHNPDSRTFAAQYTTPHGQNQSFKLPDGSTVTLAADSALRVRYGANTRSLDLVSGEAYFEVRHDAGWPFVVQVGMARIEDLGTEFDVRRDSDQVVVAVDSGVVSVAYSEKTTPVANAPYRMKPVNVTAGREVVMATATPKRPIEHRVVDGTVGAWRTGRLQFRDTPLDTVVANINRYSATPIVLDGPEVAHLRFTGTIYVDRIDTWVAAVQKALPVSEQTRSGTSIVLALKRP